MTTTRFLLPGVVLAAFAGPSAAQFGPSGSPYKELVPSVRPVGAEEPVFVPPARVASLEGLSAPGGGAGTPQGDPVGTLTGQPPGPVASGAPVGS